MSWGGSRNGAGRPKGQGKFGEKTRPMRVPESMIDEISDFIKAKGYELPLYSSSVSAGVPVPSEDNIEKKIDLNRYLVSNPEETFLVKASGDSMIEAGIYSGDVLVVERNEKPTHGKIIVASIDGQFTVKRFHNKDGKIILKAENQDYSDIMLEEEADLIIWGIVTSVLHRV